MKFSSKSLIAALALLWANGVHASNEGVFFEAWKSKERALIIDAYEFNEIDLVEMTADKRIAAFIHKGSDGLPERYRCKGNAAEIDLCRTKWRRYAVGKELYHTRRALAKSMGLKWGAYHLARPGNPVAQANHFIAYTNPTEDEVIVLDIEAIDADKWMSLEDAEIFANHIHKRLGRWPMLYTNGTTAQHIADNRMQYRILSRLPLWYARYKPDIKNHFPKGNWDSYDIWQFQAQINCNKRRCPYRVKGANNDIDVNVVDLSVEELREIWPMDTLLEMKPLERLPFPLARPDFPSESDIMIASATSISKIRAPKTEYDQHTNDRKLFNAYAHAAESRGAAPIAKNLDMMTTSTVAKGPVNDLY